MKSRYWWAIVFAFVGIVNGIEIMSGHDYGGDSSRWLTGVWVIVVALCLSGYISQDEDW